MLPTSEFSATMPVRRKELAQWLAVLRDSQQLSLQEAGDRMQRSLSRLSRADLARTALGGVFRGFGIRGIEDPTDATVELTPFDLILLADTYRFSPALLHPFSSPIASHDTICLVERFSQFRAIAQTGPAGGAPSGAYSTPQCRLRGAENVDLVHVLLPSGAHSDAHWHPGQEFMFVRRGTVDVWFRESGLRARLGEWDYIHFCSEQEHCAFNHSGDDAEVFVLRFRPREGWPIAPMLGPVRRSRSSKTPRHGTAEGPLATRHRPSTATPVVGPSVMPHWSPEATEPLCRLVLDPLGLAGILQTLCSEEFREEGRLTLDELAKKDQRLGFSRSKFHRLHHGTMSVTAAQLLMLAPLYDAKAVLFYDYLFPVVPNAIAVRQRAEPRWDSLDEGDLRTVAPPFTEGAHCVYRVPCRRLAGAGAAITSLDLPVGGFTAENRHPGHEILLPLRGTMRVSFGQLHVDLDADDGMVAHFPSHRSHKVSNVGERPAQVLVIRVYT